MLTVNLYSVFVLWVSLSRNSLIFLGQDTCESETFLHHNLIPYFHIMLYVNTYRHIIDSRSINDAKREDLKVENDVVQGSSPPT